MTKPYRRIYSKHRYRSVMSARVAVTGVLLVFIMVTVVFMVEMMVPLSLYGDFNELCRIALIRMEVTGGLTSEIEDDLSKGLSALNLTDVSIDGTDHAKYGESIRLQVLANIKTREIVSLFQRAWMDRTISYDKTSVSRRIIK